MQITAKLPKRRTRSRSGPSARVDERPARRNARRGGGPEDQAFYSCMCGYAFKAAVTTSVGCPHCGTQQAW
jgi:rubrerythrin